MNKTIINIAQHPELITKAAEWFSSKWRVTTEAYIESMNEALSSDSGIPSWYVILDENDSIIAGCGIIENDFHTRKDLTPNICAVFVEKPYRCQGLAKSLLDNACADLKTHGIDSCYLTTDHESFYEKCGWSFYGMIAENDGNMARCYQKSF